MDRARRWFLLTLASVLTAMGAAQRKITRASIAIQGYSADGLTATVGLSASYRPSTKPDRWLVNWGDGSETEQPGRPPSTLSHRYAQGGNYSVRFAIWDDRGGYSEVSAVGVIVYTQPPPVGGGERALVTQSDIQYLGTAVLPALLSDGVSVTRSGNPNGTVPVYRGNGGLTVRSISGTPYFISTAYNTSSLLSGYPYRFHCSSWATAAPFPTCTIDEEYGDVFDGKRVDLNNDAADGIYSGPLSLYWEESASKFWWTFSADPYANDCAGTACPNPSLGYSTLGSSSGIGQASYSFETISFKIRNGPILQVPSWFSDQYFEGKDYLLGNKGYQSGGGSSLEHAGTVLDLPTGAHLSEVPLSSVKQVMARDWTVCGQRLTRPAWLPALVYALDCTVGVTQWLDYPAGDMVWIDTGVKHGLVAFGSWALNFVSYIGAEVQQGGITTGMAVIDPTHLAEVYAGTRAVSNVPFSSSWEFEYPIYDYAAAPFIAVDKTAATVDATASTDRYRFTFSSAHGMAVDDRFIVTGSGGTAPNVGGFDHGYKVVEVVSSTQFDACPGQACGEQNVTTDYSGSNIQMHLAAPNFTIHSVVMGAVWNQTGSPCGQDNAFAVVMDSDYPTGSVRRYVHCFQVN